MFRFFRNLLRWWFPVPAKRESDGTQWCLVGNIVDDRQYGEGSEQTRPGTKHFSAGTKVYCLPAQWGDGYDQIIVIGRHRRSKQFVTMLIRSDWITNWRAKVVYEPEVLRRIRQIEEQRRANWRTKEEVESMSSLLHSINRTSKPTNES